MARPERNSVDYFPFYCEEGKKMFYIEQTYGNDGFAVFVKLLRELAKTEYHYLDLSNETTLMFLSAKCSVKTELMTSIINDLVKLNKFNKQLWEEKKIIWCQDFIDSIQDAYSRRNNKCITFDGLCSQLGIKCSTKTKLMSNKDDNKPQSKVEYSKEEDKKVKESKEEEIKDDFDLICEKWFEYKKQRKESYKSDLSKKSLKTRLIKLSNSNIKLANEIIEQSISNNWAGIFELKENKNQQTNSSEPIRNNKL